MFIVIPLKILETLTCTECHFYFTTRVKVYKNGKIKCERCSRDNDGGTISKLYDNVLKNTLFPCINHYSGCRYLLRNYEVAQHEVVCTNKEFIYNCLLCNTYNHSIAYRLQHHLENIHEEYSLAKPEFFVNLNNRNQNHSYYYKEDSLISFIFCKYHAQSYKFTFNLYCAIHESHRTVTYRLSIFNTDKKRICKTGTHFCSLYPYDIEFDILKVMHLVRDRIIIVRLEIFEDNILMIPENITYLNPTLSAAKFRCKFNNISLFELNNIGYSKSYYVGDIPWRVEISKCLIGEEPYLSVYLTTENEISYSFYINASFTLISTEPDDSKTKFFGKNFQNIDGGGFDDVLKWRYLVDSNFGYLEKENDTIAIDVWLEVGVEKLLKYKR